MDDTNLNTFFAKWSLRVAAFCAALIVAANASAVTETVLYSFTGGSDGAGPQAGLIADSTGSLYGTTVNGGAPGCTGFPFGCGVVFRLEPSGTEMPLYSFRGGNDGALPVAGLIADSAGNLYGTTVWGGSESGHPGCAPLICGVVFKVSPGGTETLLHSFAGIPDGAQPQAGLVADRAGNLYGTTQEGGAVGAGVVFKVSPGGTETVLYSFTDGADGGNPQAGLIADSAGNLYGTTFGGGASQKGVVFKLSPSGTETVLHSFTGDGSGPAAGLVADRAANLYGTTNYGGASDTGVVFKLSPDGTYRVLYSFLGGSDGVYPKASLVADSIGNLYGTTVFGGASGAGVVFKVSPDGTETVLHSFTGGSDGAYPEASLIADSIGNLYGTTQGGGVFGHGVVFKLSDTGFVPAIPFSAFQAALRIEFGKEPNTDAFHLRSDFVLGQYSNGIDPPAEPVTIQIGTFSTTIPPGSFKASEPGSFHFAGTINDIQLEVGIERTAAKQYAFDAVAHGANLRGTANPVTVTLTIGNDTGSISVNAVIVH